MIQKAIAVYLDDSDKMEIELSWLHKSWLLWGLEKEYDLVVYFNPSAIKRIAKFKGIKPIPMPYIRLAEIYKFLNSHYFCFDKEAVKHLEQYEYLMKTDCDVFLTERMKGFVPSKFMVGQGGYYQGEDVKKIDYIRKLSKIFGLNHNGMNQVGATFFSKTKEVLSIVSNQAALTESILQLSQKNDEFKNVGFHNGISSMIAGEIIINNSFTCQHVNLHSLDSKCWLNTKIGSDILHIHAWHTDQKWSKHSFFKGEYDNWKVELKDAFSNAANYCQFIANLTYDELWKLKELYESGELKPDYKLFSDEKQDRSFRILDNLEKCDKSIKNQDITVVLNGWKRSQHFDKQLEAIKNQTIPPKSIMLWQNGDETEFPESSNNLTKSICNDNLGVWARFAFALNARTEWICIFDDDTIPGNRWFENCLETMKTHEGLLGTVGIRVHGDEGMYPLKRYGWADINNNKPMEVDFVGHSWFFKREWLSYFWRELPDRDHSMLIGEDMHFSIMLRKWANINTYVPPHPTSDRSLWGSQPDTAWTIGTENVAISINPENRKKMSIYAENCKKIGFVPLRKKSNFKEDENPFLY